MKTLVLFLICFFVACSTPQPTAVDAGPHRPTPYAADASATTGMAVPRSVFMPHRPIARPQPPQPDTRSPSEIAQAACFGPQGWRCPKLVRKTILATSSNQPIIPASWTVPNWYIDPANSSGCASDTNSGTSATCGSAGVGPLKTWGELQVHRWGCFGTVPSCPVINQATTISFLSSQSSPWNDPVNVNVSIAYSGSLVMTGTPTTATTTTIGTFTARNRTAGTKNTITASGQSGSYWTPYVGHLVHDTTNNAYFWIQKDNGNATASITEPLAVTAGFDLPTYVTIANGDSLAILNLPQIQLGQIMYGGNAAASFYVSFLEINGKSYDITYTSDATFNQVKFDQYFLQNGGSVSALADNCFFDANGVLSATSIVLLGGAVELNYPSIGLRGGQSELDADVLIDSTTAHFGGLLEIGRVYFAGSIDTSASLGDAIYVAPIYYADGEQWGPCTINIQGGAKMVVSGPTTSMLCTGGYKIDGTTTAFPWVAASNAYGAAAAVTPANINSYNGLTNPATGSQIFIGAL